ncbi:MAG: DUF1294 domain-containing protein [Acetobacterium sp.]
MIYLIIYLVVINCITFFLFWMDKQKSKKQKWRIPEKTLLSFSAIGGSIGGICGMKTFHHKTKHPLFFIGLPLILILQGGISIFIYWQFL